MRLKFWLILGISYLLLMIPIVLVVAPPCEGPVGGMPF